MNPDQATYEFIQKMRLETGISWEFLNKARPIIRRAFVEVPEYRRAACLNDIKVAIEKQAEVERLVRETRDALSSAQMQVLGASSFFGAKQPKVMN